MTNGNTRRRFLQITGTGAAASLAGCSALANLGGQETEDDDLLTVAVGPDPDEIDELVEAMQAGELDPMEAQERQQELIDEAVSDFEDRAEEESELTIEESTEEMGLFLVDGSAEVLIDALQEGEVSSIHTGSAYDRFLEQQQRQTPEQPPEVGDENNESANDTGSDDESDGSNGANESDQ